MLSLLLMALAGITFRGILEGYKFSQKALDTTIPNGGKVKLYFCGEHAGEYLDAKADNGVLKGEATINNKNNQVLFELNIENGKITGKYKQFVNGLVRREGRLEDCKRKGHGSEYDLSGFLIYEGEYDDDKPKDNDFDFPTKDNVKYKCNYNKKRGTIIRRRVDNPCYELEVDLENRPIRFRYVDEDKSLLIRLYLSDNMMLEYANGDVYEGDYMHDPLKDFRRKGISDVAYELSLRQVPNIKAKGGEEVKVTTEPSEEPYVVSMKAIKDSSSYERGKEEKEEEIKKNVNEMKGIEDSNWKEITDPDKGYSIRIGPKSDHSTAGMYAIYHNGKCMRIGTTKDGIMHGRELGFDDDTGKLVYQTEYENGKKKRRWLIKDNKITAVKEYDNGGISRRYSQWWLLL